MESLKSLRSDSRQFILPIKTLQSLPKDKKFKLLDVGSGEHLLKKFIPENIEYCSLDYEGKQSFIHNLDKFPIPIKDKSFDVVVCLENLEHTMYPHRVMEELVRIAKPDAIFLLSMPNDYNFYCRLNFLIGRKTSAQESFMLVEKHLHIHSPRTKDIISFFSSYIKIQQIDYQWYSRSGWHHKGFIGKTSRLLDRLINPFAKLFPSLFTRTVVVKGIKNSTYKK